MYQNVETKSRVFKVFGEIAAWMQKTSLSLKLAVPALTLAIAMLSTAAEAGQTRALKIYHLHTHEKATIVFKRNGRYDAAGLKKLNYILRDWRENEPIRMDPRLFDLIWEVYQKSGSHGYINIVCGYRAPETNKMLRSRTKGVADRSQHMLGKALDFYIPDVPLKKLREIGVKFQVGGVGFYPTSGSPFVHMDVGGVRAWPRLPRRELSRLFPDGRTLHRPLEGGTMPGYTAALADYKRRVGATSIQIAGVPSKNSDSDAKGRKSLLAALFSNDDENEQEIAEADSTVAAKPERKRNKKIEADQPVVMASAEMDEKPEEKIKAPVPKIRPTYAADEQPTLETALFGARKNPAEEAMQAALTPQPADEIKAEIKAAEDKSAEEEKSEFTDLASYHVPVPQLLGERKRPGDSVSDEVLTASVDPNDTATFAAVPVPDIRPEYETEKTETADASGDVDVLSSDVRPEEIAALAAQTAGDQADATTDEDDSIADSLDSADSNDQQNNLAEMASLDVPKDTKLATRAFVLPASVADQLSETVVEEPKAVKKGGRPTKADVAKFDDDGSIRTEPKLTRNLIAQWALTKGRVETMAKPVKAPRFVSRTMRKQPTEVYAEGFEANAVQIDPARFSGTAVNFMPVKKFARSN